MPSAKQIKNQKAFAKKYAKKGKKKTGAKSKKSIAPALKKMSRTDLKKLKTRVDNFIEGPHLPGLVNRKEMSEMRQLRKNIKEALKI